MRKLTLHKLPTEAKISTRRAPRRQAAVAIAPDASGVDPDVERLVGEIQDLLPLMQPAIRAYRADRDQTVALFRSWRRAEIETGATLDKNALRYRGWSALRLSRVSASIEGDLSKYQPFADLSYRRRSGDEVEGLSLRVWRQYLANKHPELRLVNGLIENKFGDWYDRFSPQPELALRADFLRRLRQHNRLGDMLCRWPDMATGDGRDDRGYAGPDEDTRCEVLLTVARLFQESYFTPMGIREDVRITLVPTARDQVRTPACYVPVTGSIKLKVPKGSRQFPQTAAGRYREAITNGVFKTFAAQWSDEPAMVILWLVEELLHKFQHEMVKKYLRGDLVAGDAWGDFARPLVPQFPDTPGKRFYTNSTYYHHNPIERHAESVRKSVFAVLEAMHMQANEAVGLDQAATNPSWVEVDAQRMSRRAGGYAHDYYWSRFSRFLPHENDCLGILAVMKGVYNLNYQNPISVQKVFHEPDGHGAGSSRPGLSSELIRQLSKLTK